MNEQNGILLLNYEIDPQTGEIRITGTRRSGSGGRPPENSPPPEQPGCGAAALGGFVTIFLCLIFDFNFVVSLVIAIIVAAAIYNSKKNS